MKKNILFKISLCLSVLIGQHFVTTAQVEDTKIVERAFDVDTTVSIDIKNKYGLVHVSGWNQSKVEIRVELFVKEKNEDKLAKALDGIDFDFASNKYFVTAKTLLTNNRDIKSGLSSITEGLLPSDNEMIIDYYVKVPHSAKLNIENRFGDIYIEDINGRANIDLSHGDLRAAQFSNDLKLNLKFGKARIRAIQNGNMNLEYADINITEAQRLIINSKSSDNIRIEEVSDIRLDSKRDNVFIKTMNIGDINGSFSDIQIDKVLLSLNTDCRYSTLKIENIAKEIKFVNIRSEYESVSISIPNESNLLVETTYNNGIIRYPSSFEKISENISGENEDFKKLIGKIGNPNSNIANIMLHLDQSDLNIWAR